MQIFVDGVAQRVEYEALSTVCFACGKYGHVQEMCLSFVPNQIPASLANTTGKNLDDPTVVMGSLATSSLDGGKSGSRGSEKSSDFGHGCLWIERFHGGEGVILQRGSRRNKLKIPPDPDFRH